MFHNMLKSPAAPCCPFTEKQIRNYGNRLRALHQPVKSLNFPTSQQLWHPFCGHKKISDGLCYTLAAGPANSFTGRQRSAAFCVRSRGVSPPWISLLHSLQSTIELVRRCFAGRPLFVSCFVLLWRLTFKFGDFQGSATLLTTQFTHCFLCLRA